MHLQEDTACNLEKDLDKNINEREMVVDMLLELYKSKCHSHILLKDVLDKYNYIDESVKAWIKKVFEGVLEREITLDYIINRYSNTPVNKMKPYIRCLLRMSVYQIMYMDRVPDSAAINEAVKLAKKHKFVNLSGFVNGVLRTICKNKDNCLEGADYGVIFSVPKVIEESLVADYGREKTEEILRSTLEERHLFVRVREELDDNLKQAVFDEWSRNGVKFRQVDGLDYAYELQGTDNIGRLECFGKGLYIVQDVASMMVCEKAGIKKGDRVLDVCAAPGGKSLHAVSKGAMVEARDVSEGKVSKINENIARLNVENITTGVHDATVFDERCTEQFDVVIADVPCSGFGVMGRKPDIKCNVTTEGLESLLTLQRSIIDVVPKYVKRGGVLMYSTCTLRKAENEKQVERIIESFPEYEVESMETLFPNGDHDGFFIAKLRRR